MIKWLDFVIALINFRIYLPAHRTLLELAALRVLTWQYKLLRYIRCFKNVYIFHSFGGQY
jgi:hypothetical protein